MNKDQRQYLTKWVNDGFDRERKQIAARRTPQPSLNNYLTAAALAGTLQMQSVDSLKSYIEDKVKTSGPDDALVSAVEEDGYRSNRSRHRSTSDSHQVTVEAERLFVLPDEYATALEAWKVNESQVEADLEALEGVKSTVLLKVNIGSDKALESIIAQADSLGTLDLVNRQLTGGSKQIETGDQT